MFHIGIDLAWADKAKANANESGIVMLKPNGDVDTAGWTVGIDETISWLDCHAPTNALAFVDAPLVVNNACGQRLCEKEVGQRYGRWRVAANSTNQHSRHLAGVKLLRQLTSRGWTYHDGVGGPPGRGRFVSECYPYTTIVGARELGYTEERPRYKRKPKRMRLADFRLLRRTECDELIRRVADLQGSDPPMNLTTHQETRRLIEEKSPISDKEYKHREDLLDAALCAWTAALWARWGTQRCQVLGAVNDGKRNEMQATIIAPARPEQRR